MRMVETFSKGNKLAFSKRVGMSNQALGEIVGEKNTKPSFQNLEKIAGTFTEVRTEWLLLGEGEMLKKSDLPQNAAGSQNISSYKAPEPSAREYQRGEPASHEGQSVPTFRVRPSGTPPDPPGTDLVRQVEKHSREIGLLQQVMETVVAELRQLHK